MRRSSPPAAQPIGWDPDEHWERGHRELRKLRVKQAAPYVLVGVGILALVLFALSNEPEVDTPDELPVTVPVEGSSPSAGEPEPGADPSYELPDDPILPGATVPPDVEPVPLPPPVPVPLPGPEGPGQHDT